MAECSGCGIEVDESKIVLPATVATVCTHFHIDPLRSISEGTLLIASTAGSSASIIEALASEGIGASIIGQFNDGHEIRSVQR